MEAYIDSLIELFSEPAAFPAPPSKLCRKCNLEKPFADFGKRGAGLASQCKPCVNAAQKAYLASSEYAKQSKKETQRNWAAQNPDKVKAKQRRCQGTANRRAAERRKIDPNFRFAGAMRNRINAALKGSVKSAPTLELLGCDLDYLRAWIASLFAPGMTWDNYGSHWEFDHVAPCCSFDLTLPEQQKACFSWKNMRPMRCSPNRSKNGRLPPPDELESHALRAQEWHQAHPNTFALHGNNLKD